MDYMRSRPHGQFIQSLLFAGHGPRPARAVC